ncbi:MAG: alginate export family protein [Caulobacteraceae bacterium]
MTRGHFRVWAASAGAVILSTAGTAHAQSSISDAVGAGKLILEERLRYEGVDQAPFARDAQALTLRTHLGWETGAWENVKAAVEFEDVRHVGAVHYNTTINGKTLYPTVADPDVTELDRAQLTWTPIQQVTATVGRQRINLDDQRFIGAVNWRQDDQTIDAGRVDGAWGKFKGTYIYLNKINRTVAQAADWNSDSHAFAGYYTLSDALKAEGFLYAFNFRQAPALSTETVGGKLSGQTWLSLYQISYAAAYADQRNYGVNNAHYHAPYWTAELAGTFDIFQAKVNYESLGSDGTHGFSTPLATLHLWQGWADAFTTTPAKGVDDLNFSATISPRWKWDYLYNFAFFVRHHDFSVAKGSGSLGHEWDASAQANITPKLVALIKWADFEGVPTVASRRKLWLQLDYNF